MVFIFKSLKSTLDVGKGREKVWPFQLRFSKLTNNYELGWARPDLFPTETILSSGSK